MLFQAILRSVDRHLYAVLAAVFLIRAGFLWFNGLDLIGDESYYWDWSRQPDWCYYSKPPMVAWLIGAFTWLLGDYTAVVRLPALVLGTVFLLYLHATTRAFFGRQAAALVVLLMLATPGNVLANFLMTIDAPLYCFWMMTLFYLRRALFDGQTAGWWWAGCASAAALLSKQVALALPIMLLVYLLLDARRWPVLQRQFWIYLAPMVLACVPILLWNQQHDWVMFGHSKGHFASPESVSLLQRLEHGRDFLLYQVLLWSPLIWLLVIYETVRGAVSFKFLSAEQQFLWLMGPVLLLAVLLMSFMQKAQGNWAMPFYFSGILLLTGRWVNGAWAKTIKYALAIGYVVVLSTYLLPVILPVLQLKDSDWDPTKRFKNWHTTAADIHLQRQKALPRLEDSFVVALGHRYLASQLAFYLPDHPRVYRYETSGLVASQYEVWPGPDQYVGKHAFIIAEVPEQDWPTGLKNAFTTIRLLAKAAKPDNKQSSYFIYLAETLIAWPDLAERSQQNH